MMRPKRAVGMISDVETDYWRVVEGSGDVETLRDLRESRRLLFKGLTGRFPTDKELEAMD